MQDPKLAGEVSQRVLIGLMAQQHLEADFFPGILEGLAGRLGLAPRGTVDPPTSIREGVARCWATVLKEAVQMAGGAGWDHESAAGGTTPHGLHLNYDVDFQSRRVGDIAPTLTSPLLPTLVSDLSHLEGPHSAGPPPPQSTLLQAPSQLPPSKEADDQETYSPGVHHPMKGTA